MVLGIIGGVVKEVLGIIDKSVTDKDQKAKIQQEITMQLMDNDSKLNQAAADIIKTEAQSEHKITSTWRPILMLSITAILVNNFILAPYMMAIFGWSVFINMEVAAAIPEGLWNLLLVGVGGYIMGRSGEKIAKEWNPRADK